MTPCGSPSSFEALYRAEHARLLGYLRKRVGSDAASDLVQDCGCVRQVLQIAACHAG